MKNYSSEYEPTSEVAILLFGALRHALFAATDFLQVQARRGVNSGASTSSGLSGKKVGITHAHACVSSKKNLEQSNTVSTCLLVCWLL